MMCISFAGSLPKVYNLDSTVNVWADYLRTRYHPRTVSIINEYEHNSDTKPFDVFNYGTDVWKTEQFQDDFIDRIRMYVEECDNMQVKDTLSDDATTVTQLPGSLLINIYDVWILQMPETGITCCLWVAV